MSVHKKNKGIHHDVTQWFVQSGVWTLKLIIMAVAMLAFWNSTSQSQSDCESEGHCTLLSNTRKKKEIKYTVFFIFLFDINGNITRKTNKMLDLTWPKTSKSVRNKPNRDVFKDSTDQVWKRLPLPKCMLVQLNVWPKESPSGFLSLWMNV